MKWLQVSLVTNGLFVVALLRFGWHSPEKGAGSDMSPKSALRPVPLARTPVGVVTAKPAGSATYLAALRAAGVPEQLIARVVVADFDERWQHRVDDLQARYARGEVDGSALAALTRRRRAELESELKTALGEQEFRRWDAAQVVQGLHLPAGALSSGEENAIYILREQLRQELGRIEAARDQGRIDDEQFSREFASAQRNGDQQLQALLGPQRVQEMEVPSGESDTELRRALRKINASDLQFETVVEMQKSWLAQRTELERQLVQGDPQKAPALEDQLRAVDAARDEEYRRVLGSAAFDAMQKEQDARYETMRQYGEAWNLDAAERDNIYRSIVYYEKVVQDYREQARAIESRGQSVDWNAINENLRRFTEQAATGLKSSVGPDLFTKLAANHVLPFDVVR